MTRPHDLEELLEEQERLWNQRPLLSRTYGEWYEAIVERLSSVPGASIELGSGIGKLREFAGDRVVLTDVEKTRWVDARIDAAQLPYEPGSLANIVMLDVFHHLPDPARFFDEARRTLAPGGRVVMIEPYCSPGSTFFYKLLHHERTDLAAAPLEPDAQSAASPLESNQALPTLIFYRYRDEFLSRWPELACSRNAASPSSPIRSLADSSVVRLFRRRSSPRSARSSEVWSRSRRSLPSAVWWCSSAYASKTSRSSSHGKARRETSKRRMSPFAGE